MFLPCQEKDLDNNKCSREIQNLIMNHESQSVKSNLVSETTTPFSWNF